jgi:hypothetical protein
MVLASNGGRWSLLKVNKNKCIFSFISQQVSHDMMIKEKDIK